jgi:DnaJ homologue, subfamily C, member 28, conserved domain
MDKWENIAERKIREAMAEGAFDNLKGRGQPLDLEEDPYEDPSMRMAHRLLRNNGFAPAWIEEVKDLEHAIEVTRRDMARALTGRGIEERQQILGRFREQVAEINRRILTHNLKTPSTQFHMPPVDVERLIDGQS